MNLISAGKRIINKVGIRALVVADAARDAGISKGSFYAFFSSREEFLLAVFETWEDEFRGELLKRLLSETGSIRQRWERFFIGIFAILDREPGLAQMGSREVQMLMDRLPAERLAAHQAHDQKVMGEAFGQLLAQGVLAPGDAAAFQGVTMALFAVIVFRDQFPPGSFQPTTQFMAEALALRFSQFVPLQGVLHD